MGGGGRRRMNTWVGGRERVGGGTCDINFTKVRFILFV